MRIALCDYSGHAFTVQLARELAKRGHHVLYLYFSDFVIGRGRLHPDAGDPQTLEIASISLGKPFAKYLFIRRRFQERKIGVLLVERIGKFAPDVVVGCNLPLDCLRLVAKHAHMSKRKFVFWVQDIYSTAIRKIMQKRLGPLGTVLGAYYRQIEKRVMATSDALIVISSDYKSVIDRDFNLSPRNVHVIENWAPFAELSMRTSEPNDWGRRYGLVGKDVVLYSGTIGLKHDASILMDLARALRSRANTILLVASEGQFVELFREQAHQEGLKNVLVLPFQSYIDFPDMLATATVTVAILEPEAGAFSVPSKILSYLCAGRPVVLIAPTDNLATRTVATAKAGTTVRAGDRAAFVTAVQDLLDDPKAAQSAGANAQAYAENMFNIGVITDRFEKIFIDLCPEKTNRNTDSKKTEASISISV
jgi:colanic acid biosynthesis glycosyl transferase WcaI